MLIEQVLGNLAAPTSADDTGIDWLDLSWAECHLRALRKTTRSGRLVRVLLPVLTPLRHGDVLLRDGTTTVAVHVRPAAVLVARPPTRTALARLALDLGNLHVPTEVDGDILIVHDDGPARAALARHGLSFECLTRRFAPEACSVPAPLVTPGGAARVRAIRPGPRP
jgi:urease accessory protein UreE